MLTFILNIIFWSVLAFCGWQVARFIFKKANRIELLLPLSLTIGYAVYIFFLNISSYFIPIRLNFYLVFIVLLIVAFILFFLDKQRPGLRLGLNKKESVAVFSVVFVIMILTGLIVSRHIGTDNLAHMHLPAASSIVGGNFPIKHLNLPNYNSVSHHGPNLFYAAISKITGLSVVSAFNFSVFLFSGIIFLLIFNIAKLFIKNNIGSFLVALVGMFGGGFRFIYGFDGLITLFKKFILHYNIEHPFKFFGEIWSSGTLTAPLVKNIFYNWGALGWALALAIIYLYLRIIRNKKWSYYYDFLTIILLTVLALNFEMAFLILCFSILVAPFIFYLKYKNRDRLKLLLKHSLLILVIVGILVLIQGGTITAILKNIIQHRASYGTSLDFSFFKAPLSFFSNNKAIPFYNFIFVLNFGLIYFLIIPAIIFLVRKHFKKSVFLTLVSCFSFLIPLCISFGSEIWQGTMNRFFRFNSAIWAILVGLFLIIILLQIKNKGFFKKVIYICLIIICLEGILFLTIRPLYKRDAYRLDNNKFFTELRPQTNVELAAYDWVKDNSCIKDYFLFFADENDIDNHGSIFQNFRFVLFAQRLAPIYTYGNNYVSSALPPDDYYTPIYKRLIFDCSKDDMEALNYKYLFVDNNWPGGLEEKCLENNDLELEFEAEEGDKFIRIYKVL